MMCPPTDAASSSSATVAAGAPADEAELTATKCSFDASELRWVAEGEPVRVCLKKAQGGSWRFQMGDKDLPLADVRTVAHVGAGFLTFNASGLGHVGLRCSSDPAAKAFFDEIGKRKADYERFEQYEQNSVQSYFQYYSKLANQQNMLQDSVRTTLYRRAILENVDDFRAASVMDIGAGSGILSFFAAQAGASVVYAVEASSMADVVRTLAASNGFEAVKVINKPLELVGEDDVHGKVDCLVSEPIGTFLFNERMIESYLVARDRFLKPGGKMFPNVGTLSIAPFSDPVLHWEHANKSGFWKNADFYGIDLTAAAKRSEREHWRQPVVDYINPECLASEAHVTRFDFATITVESLHKIEIPFDFEIYKPCLVHGMAGWFDALFEGSNQTITMSTAPWCPGTHWYQIRFVLETPLAVNAGQRIEGTLRMEANNVQSYHVKVHMQIKGTSISSETVMCDLKDPEYRFYTSQNAYCPPGTMGNYAQTSMQQAHGTGYQTAHWASSQAVPASAPPQVQQQFVATPVAQPPTGGQESQRPDEQQQQQLPNGDEHRAAQSKF